MPTPEMTPERWRQVQWLFDAVLSREAEERRSFLAEATAEDPTLRREVESLIRSLEAASGFIDQPMVDLRSGEPEPFTPGTRVGSYRLERLLGSGGVGRVYLAKRADQVYEKDVAVKVIKRGMDTEELVRRFVSERQILAQLDHPNIAKLLDGGATSDGRPYLVMEYVDGVPIDRWCADNKLGVRQRIELFLSVCTAVQFAHRNLVIHRDLKPGNILVGRDGNAKLLDFGIAKLLSPQAFPETVLPTAPGWRAMTPEYASPEQVRGEPVTTASDVYALGMVLYELLAGQRPYSIPERTPAAIERAVCDTEPRLASKAAITVDLSESYGDIDPRQIERRLTGDLDHILRMALEKEPERRYASVDQLAADLTRHIEGQPVLARRHTFLYRASKFIRRNRLAVSAATLLFVSLIGFLTTLLVQRAETIRQRDRAELVVDFLIGLFEVSDPSRERGESVTARELLDQGARDIERRLGSRPGLQGELMGTMGATYTKLGLYDEAQDLLEQSVELTETSYGAGDPAIATALHRLADLYYATNDYEAAEALADEAVALRSQRLGEQDAATLDSQITLAKIRYFRGAFDESDLLFDRVEQEARNQGFDEKLIRVLHERALLAIDRGDYANGTVQLSEALDLAERFWGDDHPEVAMIQGQLAEQAEHDDPERSVALFTRAIDMLRRVYSGPHPDLASTINNYAVFNLDRGRFEDARTGFEEALDMQRQVYDQPGTLEAIILNNLGRYHAARGDNAEALRLWRRSFELHRQIFGDTHEETSNMRINLGVALRLNGELDRAETLLNEALENIRAVFGENHRRVAAIYNNLGKVAQDRGDLEQATAHYERAVEIFRAIELPTADLANTLQNLATLADRRGDAAAAESLYLEALDALTMAGRDEGPEAARLYNNLSVTKFLSKDFDQAAEWSRRALAIFERIQEPGSADRLRTRRILARALEEQSLYAEAAPLMRENIEACKTAWGDDAEACARHVVTLDRLYEKWPEGASASR